MHSSNQTNWFPASHAIFGANPPSRKRRTPVANHVAQALVRLIVESEKYPHTQIAAAQALAQVLTEALEAESEEAKWHKWCETHEAELSGPLDPPKPKEAIN